MGRCVESVVKPVPQVAASEEVESKHGGKIGERLDLPALFVDVGDLQRIECVQAADFAPRVAHGPSQEAAFPAAWPGGKSRAPRRPAIASRRRRRRCSGRTSRCAQHAEDGMAPGAPTTERTPPTMAPQPPAKPCTNGCETIWGPAPTVSGSNISCRMQTIEAPI
jgi:hypothetical protein